MEIFNAMPQMLQTASVGGMLAALALIVMCFLRERPFKVLLFVVALICSVPALNAVVAYHPELIDARYRTYRQFYAEIRPGMSREDLIFTEQKHYPLIGERASPFLTSNSPKFLSFFMNPEDGPETSGVAIFVQLEGNKVVSKEYTVN